MPKVPSRKFVTPVFKGDKTSFKEDNVANEKSQKKPITTKAKALPCSLSESQYDELFREVIKESSTLGIKKTNNPLYSDDSDKEHSVVVPEPNAALSPDEEADGTENDSRITEGFKPTVTTPDCPIDNSVLPPLKKKKPISRIQKYKHKLKPTRLNFDDPNLIGKPEKIPKPLEPTSMSIQPSENPKKYENPPEAGKPEGSKKSRSLQKTSPNKINFSKSNIKVGKHGNGMCTEKLFLSPNFQNREADARKQSKMKNQLEEIISSNSQQTDSSFRNSPLSQATPKSRLLGSQSDLQVLSPRSRLFKLQKKRNVGLWVQCTKKDCSKWRYLASVRDPTEVPDNWQCFMNHDKQFASCSVPEKGPTPMEEEDLIHNLYTAGSLVWARLSGYPWWPAIVDDDPDVEQYYWVTDFCDIPTHYSVAFFDEKPVTRAWLTPSALTSYSVPDKKKNFRKTTVHGVDYSQRLKVAISQADEAKKLPVHERLKEFSFVARYKGPIGMKRNLPDSPVVNLAKKAKKVDRKTKSKERVSEEDAHSDLFRSLEVVEEVNKVLSQLTSESESEEGDVKNEKELGSEEDPHVEISESLETVKEVNKVLSQLTSDSKSEEDTEAEAQLSTERKSAVHIGNSRRKVKNKTIKKSVPGTSGRPGDGKGGEGSKSKKKTAKDESEVKIASSDRIISTQNKEASGRKVSRDKEEKKRESKGGAARGGEKGGEESEEEGSPLSDEEEGEEREGGGGEREEVEEEKSSEREGECSDDDIDSDTETLVGRREDSKGPEERDEEEVLEQETEIGETPSSSTSRQWCSRASRASVDLFERRQDDFDVEE